MLVLSRKVGERIQIGDAVTVTVVRINANSVRIGIDAPADMIIAREELIAAGVERPGDDTTAAARPKELSLHVEKSSEAFHIG